MNGIFILMEGIDSTIFTSQVSRHVKEMRDRGIDMQILALEPNRKNMKRSSDNLERISETDPNTKIHLHPCVNTFLPFSIVINAIILLYHFSRLNGRCQFKFVHARADYCSLLCLSIRAIYRIPVLWDCRGDSVAEVNDLMNRRLPRRLKYFSYYFVIRQRILVEICRRFFKHSLYVSSSLQKERSLHSIGNETVIPCLVSDQLFFQSDSLRKNVRDTLGFKDSDIVVLYAGGLAAYQGLSRILSYFKSHQDLPRSKILVVTPDADRARDYFALDVEDKLVVISASFEDMNGIYNAADIGILLREPSAINKVASPTKFGEYCMTGLPVVSNDTIDQVQECSKAFGNFHPESSTEIVSLTCEQRRCVSKKAKEFFGRNLRNSDYLLMYTSMIAR